MKINTPFITQGDWFQTQVNVTQGALRYLFNTPNTDWGKVDGGKETFGILSDCVYAATAGSAVGATGCLLTSAWGINASYEHYWTPAWHTSLYGAYYQVNYGGGIGGGNATVCSALGGVLGGGTGTAAFAAPGCNMNWSDWGIGSRTQWDVTKTFYLGVEVLYAQMNGASTPGNVIPGASLIAGPSGVVTNENRSSAWTFTLRAHRDFLP